MSEKNKRKSIEFRIDRNISRETDKKILNTRLDKHSNKKQKKIKISKNDNLQIVEQNNLNNVFYKLLSTNENCILIKKYIPNDNKKFMNKKRNRNLSTNSKSSLDEIRVEPENSTKDNILDYDLFLNEINSLHKPKIKKTNQDDEMIKSTAPSKKKVEEVQKKKIIIQKRKSRNYRSAEKSKNTKIYDIDNFVIQSNALRIHQRTEKLDIPIPVFKEIDLNLEKENFDLDRNDNLSINIRNDCDEDTSDEFYKELHKIFEEREREYYMSFYKKKKDKIDKSSDKLDKGDQATITGVSNCDNLTAKSNDDMLNSNMKIRINLNILSNTKVKI